MWCALGPVLSNFKVSSGIGGGDKNVDVGWLSLSADAVLIIWKFERYYLGRSLSINWDAVGI